MRIVYKAAFILIVVNLLVFSTISKCGANWEVEPLFELAGNYTDNVGLQPEGAEQSEFITQLIPQLNITGQGAKTLLDLRYRYEKLLYSNESSRNTGYHQARLNFNRELYNDHLFLDMLGAYDQEVISNQQSENIDNVFVSEDRTDVGSFNISPYGRFVINGEVFTNVRVAYGEVKYQDQPEFDSKLATAIVSAEKPPQLGPLGWNMQYQSSIAKTESTRTELNYGTAEAVYRANERFNLLAGVLYEFNKYEQELMGPSTNGTFFIGGLQWRPNSRTYSELRCGERFFGNACSFLFSNETQHTRLHVSYNKNVETSVQRQLRSLSDGAAGGGAISSVQVLTNEVYVTERWEMSSEYNKGRSVFGLSYYDEEIQYQTDFRKELLKGADLFWDRRMSRRMTLRTTLSWEEREYSQTLQKNNTRVANIRLNKVISRSINGGMYYQYRNYMSTEETLGYHAQLVGASLTISF